MPTRLARDSGSEVRDTDPARPSVVGRPTAAGTYGIRIITSNLDVDTPNRWQPGNTRTRNMDVPCDPSKHCRIYQVDGEWIRSEEDDYVITQAVKR